MDIVLIIHSILRWVILAVAVVALVNFGLAWSGRPTSESRDRALRGAFVGLLDLQVLVGLIYLIGTGFTRQRGEHAFTMIVALVLAHLSVRWKNDEPRVRGRKVTLMILAVLLLIVAGVSRVPGGWSR
jgi:hypothetical protein